MARAGHGPTDAWFLKIDPARMVDMRVCVCVRVYVCVCACVCVSTPEANNN